RTRARAGFERLAVLERFECVRGRIANRGDSPCQERAAEGFAVALREMRVDLDQSGNHRFIRRVDHGASVQAAAMLLDALDSCALDDDVDVRLDPVAAAIP